jgi:transposase
MMLIIRPVGYSAALMRYLNSRSQSCYCAPMIWGFAPEGALPLRVRARDETLKNVADVQCVTLRASMSCCRFDGHRDWVFHTAGGRSCRDGSSVESSRSRPVKLVRERGVSVAQAGRDLGVHENVLRKWVKEFGTDPVQAFPGHGQMKPEQQEIERLRREVAKLKAERDILKNCPGPLHACAG